MKQLLKSRLTPEVLRLVQSVSEKWTEAKCLQKIPKSTALSINDDIVIASAVSSARIEGCQMTFGEIADKCRRNALNSHYLDDEAHIAGYIEAKRHITENLHTIDISEESICNLHSMVTQYLAESSFPHSQRGVYKNITNSVVKKEGDTGREEIIFVTTPPGSFTEYAMKTLIEDYNDFIYDPRYSSLQVIAAFIVKFLAIHPFRDENGPVSRLLTDLCLAKQGYKLGLFAAHEPIIEANREAYYSSLRQTQSTLKDLADMNAWFHFFLSVMCEQLDTVLEKVAEPETDNESIVPFRLSIGCLTEREEKVYKTIKSFQPVNIGFLERRLAIKRVTLKSILARLKLSELIVMEGEGKGSRYWLAV